MTDDDLTPTDPLACLRAREALREAEAELEPEPPTENPPAPQPIAPNASNATAH